MVCRNTLSWLWALGAAMSGCNFGSPAARTLPPPIVVVSYPIERQVTDYQEFTGRTEAIDAVQVRARVTGYLDKIYFKDGDEVQEDALLFEIDPRPYQAALDQAEAQVKL